MRKILPVLLVALILTGCAKYPSHYNAVGFVHSNDSSSAFMDFHSFDGDISFKLKIGERLKYSGKLGSGSATVYYDSDGTKKELFKINAGDEVESSIETPGGGSLYIIVETDEKCEDGEMKCEVEGN